MNFAQLLDPEWVMDGAKERFKRRRAVVESVEPEPNVMPSPISGEVLREAKEQRDKLARLAARRAQEAAERARRSGRVHGLKGRSHALLALLAKCPEGLTAREVREHAAEQAPREDPRWVYAMLSNLCNSRLLSTRVYISGAVYHITEAGRERVVPEAARWTREG